MTSESVFLLGTAGALGVIHTVLGPDHYVPFTAMARARRWSMRRTLSWTLLSGLGHVTSSIVIGLVGLVFGVEVLRLTKLESLRGNLAGWLLLGFGLAYMLWGIRRAARATSEQIVHAYLSESEADHSRNSHAHGLHTHVHGDQSSITPWVLFTILVFGPCEPLIPVIMYPAARADAFTVFLTALTFSVCTIATMTGMVYLTLRGAERIRAQRWERYAHALAGGTIAACGAGITFLGL